MLNKEIKFGKEARNIIQKGINTVADAVKVTLGPCGHCVIIGDLDKSPRVTKDGVSVAKEIKLKNIFENTGAMLIREAAEKTLNTVGDATTTSTVLAQAIINLSKQEIDRGANVEKIKEGLNKALSKAIVYIEDNTISVSDDDIKNIATISSNNDEELGNMIADAFSKIGRDGIITVEESSNINTSIEIVDGMQFDKGYLCQHFVTDPIKDNCILENPYILATELKISNMRDIGNLLNTVAKEDRSILLIAEDFDSSVLESLKLNKLQGNIKVCAVKAPSFGDYRKSIITDIAMLTSGTPITYDLGMDVKDINISNLGSCKKAIISKDSTTLIGSFDSEDVNKYVLILKEELKRLKNNSSNEESFVVKFLQERIAKLTGGIACIHVGGTTEVEMQERKDRVDDAVAATKAAIEEGVVLGGGLTHFNASKYIMNNLPSLDKDTLKGYKIIEEALKEPFNQIVRNAGINPRSLYSKLTKTLGFNAKSRKIVNMYDEGIIDPAKASTESLCNAVSVANMFLSTDCIIVPEEVNQLLM